MFNDDMTVAQARDELDNAMLESSKPVQCPVCAQSAKIYKRSIYARMALALVEMDMRDEEWVHAPTLGADLGYVNGELGGAIAKLKHWNLIEEASGKREDGGRAGYWRVTDLGHEFAQNRRPVKKYTLVYNNVVLGFDGPDIFVTEALGEQFSYDELMSRTP